MIIYNSDDLSTYLAWTEAGVRGDDTDHFKESWKQFKTKFPYPFYSPSFFIRLGLFVLTTLVVVLFTALLYLLSGSPDSWNAFSFLLLAVGGICILGSEYLARKRKHFQSGADESLHLCAALMFAAGIGGMVTAPWWMIALLAAAAGVILFLRYMNLWMAMLAAVSAIVFFNEILSLFLPAFVYALPLSALSMAASYFSGEEFSKKKAYYGDGFIASRYIFLLGACFFSNYLCIMMLNGPGFATGKELFVYKLTTILVPLSLLTYGIIKKDRVPLRTGIITIFLSVYTVYSFTGASHPFVWMTVTGAVTILLTVILIRWLKVERRGFVYKAEMQTRDASWLEMIISANASRATAPEQSPGFGGGDFGGGGASGSY